MVQKSYIQVPFKEASRINIGCKTCKTQVLITLAGTQEQRERLLKKGDKKCSACGAPFDSSVNEALIQFNYWLESAEKSGHDISLIIDAP